MTAATEWCGETLYADWGQRFRVVRELARTRSAFQDIVVFESAGHGRVMLLDGVVQITEADEFAYQEMIAHVPLLAHGAARRVLIIGAGDGGALRRVLAHPSVERAVMVEIDGEVIRLARTHMPAIGGDAWNDPRAQVIIGNGIDYVATAAAQAFDVILVDSTDPIGVGEALFTDEFYRHCARILSPRGVVVSQCGVPFMQGDGTDRHDRPARPVLSACVGLRRRRADLCRWLHGARLGRIRSRHDIAIEGDDPRSRPGGRHPGMYALLVAGHPPSGLRAAALYRGAARRGGRRCGRQPLVTRSPRLSTIAWSVSVLVHSVARVSRAMCSPGAQPGIRTMSMNIHLLLALVLIVIGALMLGRAMSDEHGRATDVDLARFVVGSARL